jgi:DNA-binding response OmpR family regulator
MPRMTGVDCLRALKGQEKTRSIPIIMYTGAPHLEYEKQTLGLGADYFMTKANGFEDLCNDINQVLTSIGAKLKSSAGEMNM